MINTMRLKQLYTILLLCCVNICFAQNKLFDKYADMDDVTSVYISKKTVSYTHLTLPTICSV